MTQPTVGIIGLGAMGAGIAKTLRNNGFTIHVCDVRPAWPMPLWQTVALPTPPRLRWRR